VPPAVALAAALELARVMERVQAPALEPELAQAQPLERRCRPLCSFLSCYRYRGKRKPTREAELQRPAQSR